jgi:serine kinase of HPr protein (carbohydrate metabolism regulator)
MKRSASLLYALASSSQSEDTTTNRELDKMAAALSKLKEINAWRESRAKTGANIGSFKVMIAGDSGIGKAGTELTRRVIS